ncbi:MAG: 3-deoxy-D-manno-octulosonic acid transferase [Holophagales bacterium]|nr:3-deoxy-D-manno-octulosonic acid transferase [Holophagales bacterium]
MGFLRAFGWFSYQALLGASLVAAAPVLALRRRGAGLGHYLPTLGGRLALGLEPPERKTGHLWMHAVSVGEVNVAATLVRHLPADLPLVVTTVTPTGQALAERLFAERASVAYLPFDLAPLLDRFLELYDPRALVLVEGDYWPLALERLQRRGAPVAVVNGRISDRAFRRQKRLGRINRLFYGGVDRFGVQTEGDRERLAALGAPAERIVVTGNLKFDAPLPAGKPELAALISRLAAGRPVLVAGSTMEGEEDQVIAAFRNLGAGERALLLLAPRHPERWDRVAELLDSTGLTWARRRQLDTEGAESAAGTGSSTGRSDVLLLDSLGELAAVYASAAAAFIGGTLSGTGGHNPIEPARFGVPTAAGPSMQNFREIAEDFDRAGAWGRVDGAPALAALWALWLDDPARAEGVGRAALGLLESSRGAAERSADLLSPMLRRAGLTGKTGETVPPAADSAKRGNRG